LNTIYYCHLQDSLIDPLDSLGENLPEFKFLILPLTLFLYPYPYFTIPLFSTNPSGTLRALETEVNFTLLIPFLAMLVLSFKK